MGYRVIYGEDPFEKPRIRKGRLAAMTAACLLVFSMGVQCIWPAGAESLKQMIMPKETATTTAFVQMTADIWAGEPLRDAVTAFCRSVVEGAID